MATESSREELKRQIDLIEETYEYMLAYAAQGIPSEEASRTGAQLRETLKRAEEAAARLADTFTSVIEAEAPSPMQPYRDFVDVLRADALRAGAAIRLTLAQPSLSSQLVDNLNASIHLRALLTDIFLLDEVLDHHRKGSSP